MSHDLYQRQIRHVASLEGMRGVELRTLMIKSDDRGRVMKMTEVGDVIEEVYFSTVNPGVVKAWHCHSSMTLRYACIHGHVQVGLCDLRPGDTFGQTMMIELNAEEEYKLLTIPPGVWNGFRCHPKINNASIICNAASQYHSIHEITRVHPNDFPVHFDWGDYEVAG